jgi:hypothetical protein
MVLIWKMAVRGRPVKIQGIPARTAENGLAGKPAHSRNRNET